MARPKKVTATSGSALTKVEKKTITHIPVDFGREDLNNLGKKINEIIDHLNS